MAFDVPADGGLDAARVQHGPVGLRGLDEQLLAVGDEQQPGTPVVPHRGPVERGEQRLPEPRGEHDDGPAPPLGPGGGEGLDLDGVRDRDRRRRGEVALPLGDLLGAEPGALRVVGDPGGVERARAVPQGLEGVADLAPRGGVVIAVDPEVPRDAGSRGPSVSAGRERLLLPTKATPSNSHAFGWKDRRPSAPTSITRADTPAVSACQSTRASTASTCVKSR